jgi:hypothetical protein
MGIVAGKAAHFIEIGPGHGPIVGSASRPSHGIVSSEAKPSQMKVRITSRAHALGARHFMPMDRFALTFGIEVRS